MDKTEKQAAPKIRRGIHSTEFWLAFLTSAISLAVMAGVIDPAEGTSTADKIASLVVAALASMGYSISRGLAKQSKAPEDNE